MTTLTVTAKGQVTFKRDLLKHLGVGPGEKVEADKLPDGWIVIRGNGVMNRPAVESGLAVLNAGGDFADGAIAYEGNWLGAEEFVSFDAKAVSVLQSQDNRARLLS